MRSSTGSCHITGSTWWWRKRGPTSRKNMKGLGPNLTRHWICVTMFTKYWASTIKISFETQKSYFMIMIDLRAFNYTFFFYKNYFYKNHQAQILKN